MHILCSRSQINNPSRMFRNILAYSIPFYVHNCSLHFHSYKMAIPYLFHSFITHHTQFSSTTFIHPINHYLSPHMYIYCKYYIFIFCNHLLIKCTQFLLHHYKLQSTYRFPLSKLSHYNFMLFTDLFDYYFVF